LRETSMWGSKIKKKGQGSSPRATLTARSGQEGTGSYGLSLRRSFKNSKKRREWGRNINENDQK